MELTEEQAEKVKEQLFKQLENFPEDKREEIKQAVEAMSLEEFEEFLKQNELLSEKPKECIFCSIIEGKIPSHKIDEDKENLAILEINPLSKAHVLIVPKKHQEKVSESTLNLAKIIAKKIKEKLNPKEIKISETKIMDHSLVEVIPLFGNETKKYKATPNELADIQKLLTEKPKQEIKVQEKPKEQKQEHTHLPKFKARIP